MEPLRKPPIFHWREKTGRPVERFGRTFSLVLSQPRSTTRKVIDGGFRKAHLTLKIGTETSTCAEIKRYVANNIGIGIIHDICVDARDSGRSRSMSVEKFFRHPEGALIYRRPKILSSGEKKLIELLQTIPSASLGTTNIIWDCSASGGMWSVQGDYRGNSRQRAARRHG